MLDVSAGYLGMPTVAYELVASGLRAPEGPVVLPDGSLIFSELMGASVRRLWPDGRLTLLAEVAGAPNGLAFGPDGQLYVTNQGGWDPSIANGFPGHSPLATPYVGGSIQKISADGTVTTICTLLENGDPLICPDDLVIDHMGGIYFTDLGMLPGSPKYREWSGIYYLPAGAERAQMLVKALAPTNGIGLSADGKALWWTEYETGRLLMRDVIAPGQLAEPSRRYGDCRYIHPAPVVHFDSLTMMPDGGVAVAIHDGTSDGKSGIMAFDADGQPTAFYPFDDPYCAHIAFGGPDGRDAFITLLGTGRIAKLRWPVAGSPPIFTPASEYLQTWGGADAL